MASTENNNNVIAGQMKGNKQELEDKIARIIKLIENNGQDKKGKIPEDSRRKSELIGLIHDFHKQYQNLHAQYDNLRGVGIKARGPASKEDSSEDYYSSEEIENEVLANGYNKSSDNIQAEIDSEDSEASANLKHLMETDASKKDKKNKEHKGKREFSTLVKVQEVHGSRASAEIKELEGQLTMLRMEAEEKGTEVKRLGETNLQLHARISELQLLSEEKGKEISAMTDKVKEKENNLNSKNQVLATQVKDLQLEIDYLRAEISEIDGSKKNKKTTQVMSLKDQFKITQQELENLRREKSELQIQLDAKTKETTEYSSKIEALKDEIARQNDKETGLRKEKEGFLVQIDGLKTGWLKEKEGFLVQIDGLKLEVNSLHDQNNELEEMIKSRKKETDELREEKDELQHNVLELQKSLVEREAEITTIQKKKYEAEKNEASNQIAVLKARVKTLQKELDSLVGEKMKLEEQNVLIKRNSQQNLMQIENEIVNLTSKIEDQEKTLKEKDDAIKKFAEESRLIKHHSLDLNKQRLIPDSPKFRPIDSPKFNHNAFERKIDELAEKFQMKTENHIRLLSRRIRVAEQLHTETREGTKMMLEKLEQENKELNEQKTACESELNKTKEIVMELGSNMLTGFDTMIKTLDEENGKFLNRMSRISDEVQLARNCAIRKNDKTQKLKHDLETEKAINRSIGSGGNEPNGESMLDKKIEELEQKLKERETELEQKLKERDGELEQKLKERDGELEQKLKERDEEVEEKMKEREEALAGIREEKREAIRQLCELIEYHRERYADLKEAVSKMPIRFKKQS